MLACLCGFGHSVSQHRRAAEHIVVPYVACKGLLSVFGFLHSRWPRICVPTRKPLYVMYGGVHREPRFTLLLSVSRPPFRARHSVLHNGRFSTIRRETTRTPTQNRRGSRTVALTSASRLAIECISDISAQVSNFSVRLKNHIMQINKRCLDKQI